MGWQCSKYEDFVWLLPADRQAEAGDVYDMFVWSLLEAPEFGLAQARGAWGTEGNLDGANYALAVFCVESALRYVHAAGDLLAQLINLAMADEMLPVGNVMLSRVRVQLLEQVAPELAAGIENLTNPEGDWQHVADFVNTIKHRGLVPHEFDAIQWKFYIKAFDYGHRHHDELSQTDVEALVCRVQSQVWEVFRQVCCAAVGKSWDSSRNDTPHAGVDVRADG